MNRNDEARLEKLWKFHHPLHSDIGDVQAELIVIRETIETQADPVGSAGSGAYIRLSRDTTQSIAVDGEAVEFTAAEDDRLEFSPTFSTTTVTVQKTGYYGAVLRHVWAGTHDTPSAEIRRIRNGVATTVWPPVGDPGNWAPPFRARFFEGAAHPLTLQAGDQVSVFLDHGEGTAQNLEWVTLSLSLLDRLAGTDPTGVWEDLTAIAGYGVTFDGSSWWFTDQIQDVDPALFERDESFALLNSYSGYDNDGGGTKNRGIVFLAGKLWGVGAASAVSEVDPADGLVDSFFAISGDSHLGIGTKDGNLFISDVNTQNVFEYTTAGSLVGTHAMPTSHDLAGLTWDGTSWFASTAVQDGSGTPLPGMVQLNSAFNVVAEFDGPTADSNHGCHFRDGYLYVQTGVGLWRRAI